MRFVAVVLLVASAVGVFLAPLVLDASYSPVANSISESAAQQTDGAWLARFALAFAGLGVLTTVQVKARRWPTVTALAYGLFGVFWIFTAVFSMRSWIAGAPFEPVEDALHSFFASAMAVVVVGALARAATSWKARARVAVPALVLASASTLLPLGGLLWPEVAGVFQRAMFLVAYVYFAFEAVTEA